MKPGGLMPHSHGLSNNPYPEPNQPNNGSITLRSILILSSQLWLGLPKGLLPADVPVIILKEFYFLHSGYMISPSQFSRLIHPDYIRWTAQSYRVPYYEAFCPPHSHRSWGQMFGSGSWLKLYNLLQKTELTLYPFVICPIIILHTEYLTCLLFNIV